MPDANHEVDEVIRTSTQCEVPDEVRERLQYRLAEFRTKVEQNPPGWLRTLVDSLLHPQSLRTPAMAGAALLIAVAALVLIPQTSNTGRVYAAAADQMRKARSLHYKVVLAPQAEVDVTYLAPAYRRVSLSWGIEVRSDGTGRQLVLLHASRNYVLASEKEPATAAPEDFVEEWKKLPQTAERYLGEQRVGEKRLLGYRVRLAPSGNESHEANAIELWVDAATGNPEHADIEVKELDKPLYRIRVKDIRVDDRIDPSLFVMSPPADYSPIVGGTVANRGDLSESADAVQPEIKTAEAMTAVVLTMKGSYQQTTAALAAVESRLKQLGIAPAGAPFGRFESEQHWDAGYPVPPGTQVEPPFETISLPSSTVASAVVHGNWGQDSGTRWGTFFRRVVERGYVPVGPPTEVWSGDRANPGSQSIEMWVLVKKVGRPGLGTKQ